MSQVPLRDRAAQQAAAADSFGDRISTQDPGWPSGLPPTETLGPLVPMVEIDEPTTDDPPEISVHKAWARVMRDVQGVAKKGLYSGGGTRYNFRGVDQMINAFGPAMRRHGVMVIPTGIRSRHEDSGSVTSSNKTIRETTVIVSWRIYGPMGDWIDGESEGESLDSSDKGTAKGQSVALRAFLIAAGMVPTDEKDPDDSRIERGERPLPRAQEYVDEVCGKDTSLQRLKTIWTEARTHGLLGQAVINDNGDAELFEALLKRKGEERQPKGD